MEDRCGNEACVAFLEADRRGVDDDVGTGGFAFPRAASNGGHGCSTGLFRGGGNRLCEMLRYACGTDLILSAVRAAIGEPVEALSDPVYDGFWAQVILHSYSDGTFKELWIDEDVRPFVVEQALWITPGEHIEKFSGANKSFGTVVLRFNSQEEADARMADISSWLKIVTEE